MASCSQPPPPPDPAIRSPSHPSDLEVAKMLRALVDPSASPPSSIITIHEADVYAQDPADLTEQFPPTVGEDGQQAWYFSTKLLPKSRKRKRRCMDNGVWHDEGKSKSKPVVGSEARRYLFSFINKVDGKKGDRTGWIMHEFRLPVPDGNEESPAAYLMSDEEALVLIVMAAAALVARAGLRLLLPSRPAVPHCGGALEPLF